MVLGLIILFIGTCIVFIEYDLLLHFFNTRILIGPSYLIYEFILDVGGLLFLIGIVAALTRRLLIKPERLTNSPEDFIVLVVLLYIGLSGFILEGLRLAITPVPWGAASFIGFGFSMLFQPLNLTADVGKTAYIVFWWSHLFAAIFAGLIILTRTKLRHSLLYFIGEVRPLEKWLTPFKLTEVLESKSLPTKVGAKQVQEFSWSQKINLDACTYCGRCQDVCPSFRAGKILSPKDIIQKMQSCLVDGGRFNPKDIVGNYVSEEEVWLCVTDGACVKVCPLFINPLEYLIELRRHQTMNLGKPLTRTLFNILLRENPYGLPRSERVSWMRDLKIKTLGENEEVDVLYWAGCACSYDARAQRIARAIVKILEGSGVDFAVLKNEGCCGDLARRLGDEYLFQEIALKNVEKFGKCRFNTLLVTCPHCYNAFKNDYQDFGFKVKVVSHVEFINELLEENRLKLSGDMAKTVTYHDPCYLRLYNDITAPARKVLHSIRECRLVEMKDFFCCGGGGGGSWMELPAELRPSLRRFEDAEAVNPDAIVTACPYCASMFEDAVKVKGAEGKIMVRDLAEIVAELMG
jgi:Fe-S oxidoreductase